VEGLPSFEDKNASCLMPLPLLRPINKILSFVQAIQDRNKMGKSKPGQDLYPILDQIDSKVVLFDTAANT